MDRTPSEPLGDLARCFLKLGTTAFGGPAAHIAMMEDEVVERRRWMTREAFLDLVGAAHLIPGPNSTELAIHIGYARAGWPGLLVAGICFIVPAALIVTVLAWGYVRFGQLPTAEAVLYGIKPVVIAVVVQALVRLARSALRRPILAAVAALAAVGAGFGVNELVILAAAAAGMALLHFTGPGGSSRTRGVPGRLGAMAPLPLSALWLAPGGAAAVTGAGLWPLFLFFAKVGAVLFGSGYVLLAFLRSGLVVERGWLTEVQLLDAIAVGQMTPGPVFTTATFVGYLLAGGAGAAVATIGIFLPAFVFVAASAPILPRLRRSPLAGAVLDGVTTASLALMAVVTWQLGRAALGDGLAWGIAIVSAVLLLRYRINSAWLVLGGALVGMAVR